MFLIRVTGANISSAPPRVENYFSYLPHEAILMSSHIAFKLISVRIRNAFGDKRKLMSTPNAVVFRQSAPNYVFKRGEIIFYALRNFGALFLISSEFVKFF